MYFNVWTILGCSQCERSGSMEASLALILSRSLPYKSYTIPSVFRLWTVLLATRRELQGLVAFQNLWWIFRSYSCQTLLRSFCWLPNPLHLALQRPSTAIAVALPLSMSHLAVLILAEHHRHGNANRCLSYPCHFIDSWMRCKVSLKFRPRIQATTVLQSDVHSCDRHNTAY